MRYKSIPIEADVEAVQFKTDVEHLEELSNFLNVAYSVSGTICIIYVSDNHKLTVQEGEWILRPYDPFNTLEPTYFVMDDDTFQYNFPTIVEEPEYEECD